MNYCVHFFIGKEFEILLEGVANDLLKNDLSALHFNKYFLVDGGEDGKLSFKELKVCVKGNSDERIEFTAMDCLNNNISFSLSSIGNDNSVIGNNVYTEIFDSVLTVENSATQNMLDTFIYFPFYKESSIGVVENICKEINSSPRAGLTGVSFVTFGDDMSKVIEPDYKLESTSKKNLAKFDKMRNKLGFVEQKSHLIFIHDSTTSGLALGMNREKFTDMLAQLAILLSTSYKEIFPLGDTEKQATCLGFSSLYFSEYLFISYLMNKVTLAAIDNSSVNDKKVNVNSIFQTTNGMLRERDVILSNFLKKHKTDTTEGAYKEVVDEIQDIFKTVSEKFAGTKSMTEKAAILAALLSKADYELFANAVYNSENANLTDLYNEAFEYFINEDVAGYYKDKDKDEDLINPLKELKTINEKILNSSSQIRELEESVLELEKLIDDGNKVQECYVDDTITVNGRQFRLLPDFDEEPLKDSYIEHPVSVTSIDLRGNFRPVQDQGQQGSCLSFALTSIFEYMMRATGQEEYDLSEAFLYYNARDLEGNGSVNEDGGSLYHTSIESLMKYGIALEKVWPYNDMVYDKKPSQEAYDDAATRKLVKAMSVKLCSDAIKSALQDGYPVAASFNLYPSFYDNNGFIPVPTAEEIEQAKMNVDNPDSQNRHGRHTMVIVGFSDELNMFLVRNSWGESWGDKGYCYIPYKYINNPELFNYACILTEIASLEFKTPQLTEIPALKIDNNDIRIRYYVTKAALDREKLSLCLYKKQRDEWLAYFEKLKIVFSNSNGNKQFVNANSQFHNDAIKELETQNKDAKTRREEITKELNKSHIIAIVKAIASFLVAIGGCLGINKLLVNIHNNAKSDLFNELIQGNSGGFSKTIVGWLDAENGGTSTISTWFMIVLALAICLIILYFQNQKWKAWREERDGLDAAIERNLKEIILRREKIKRLQFTAFAAWTVITNLTSLQEKLLKMYNCFISLINNLRVWYKEVEQETEKINLGSTFTNISLLSEDKLDNYFETKLKETEECNVDLCENIDKFVIDANFLANYKLGLRNKIIRILQNHLEKLDFSVTEHLIKDEFGYVAESINSNTLQQLLKNSNLFAYVRTVSASAQSIVAPDTDKYESAVINRMSMLPGIVLIQSTNKYRLQLVNVQLLKYDEIVVLKDA